MASNATQIAALEELLNSGIRRTVVDGEVMEFEFAAAIRQRLRELKGEAGNGQPKRPRFSTMKFRRFYQ